MRLNKGDLHRRLTLDIHARHARAHQVIGRFTQGVTVADLLRVRCWSREFPEHRREKHMATSRFACCAVHAHTAAPALGHRQLRLHAVAALTRVALAYIDQRFDLYLRFGELARILRLDHMAALRVVLAGAISAASAGRPTTTARSLAARW